MQTVITYLTLFFTSMLLQSQNTIEVTMRNFDHNNGIVKVGLYDKKSNFLEGTYKSVSSKIKNETATVIFTDVPDGIYAISCYHDEDSNGELIMFMGMFPTESYGSSNNAPAMFGPPTWEDAKFEIKNSTKQSLIINM